MTRIHLRLGGGRLPALLALGLLLAAGAVGASSASGSSVSALPAWHRVGTAGQPRFLSRSGEYRFQNADQSPTSTRAGFYLSGGIVHLEGRVCLDYYGFDPDAQGCNISGEWTSDFPIFNLPSGFRPAHTLVFRAPSGPKGTIDATIVVQAGTGKVIARDFDYESVWLDGIAFRLDS